MDLRQHTRVITENQCTARIEMGGETYNDLAVTNLGADGCCLRVPAQAASNFKDKMVLEGMELIHPNLPKAAIQGTVVWHNGNASTKGEYLEAGIQFSDTPEGFIQKVDQYVAAMLKAEPRRSM